MQIAENNQIQTNEMNTFKRIGNIFFEPSKVFKSILNKPKNLMAIIVILILSFALVLPKIPYIENVARENTSKMYNSEKFLKTVPEISQEGIEKQIETGAKFAKISAMATPIFVLVYLLFRTLILFGVFKIFGGKGNFVQTFSVLAYSYFIILLGDVAKTVSTVMTGNIEAGNSLAFLMENDKTNYLYNLVSGIDFIYVWALVVTAIGLSIVHKVSKKKSFYLVFGIWAIFLVGSVAITTLQALSYYNRFGITF